VEIETFGYYLIPFSNLWGDKIYLREQHDGNPGESTSHPFDPRFLKMEYFWRSKKLGGMCTLSLGRNIYP